MSGHELTKGLMADAHSGTRGPDHLPRSRSLFARLIHGQTLLRATPLGELISLLMLACSLTGAVLWISQMRQNPVCVLMAAAGVWVALKSVGAFAGDRRAACISAVVFLMVCVLAITGISAVPPWLSHSLISPFIWTVLSGVVVIVDVLDCRAHSHAGLPHPERRKRDGLSLKLLFAGLFLAWGLGVPIATTIYQLSHPTTGRIAMEEMSFAEHAGFRCGEALVTACFFALGCNIGSFLNVVVWRMPLGRSIVYEKSSCPVCRTAIAGKDNIPILGWFVLGGQCRACHTEISPRYPTVEAITGSIFLLLYFAELISGGANLPVRPINMYRGVLWIIMYAKWDLIGLYLFHCFLFCMLIVLTLMTIDRSRVPRRLLAFMFAVTLTTSSLFPHLMLIPFSSAIKGHPSVTALLSSSVGLFAGVLIGLLIAAWQGWTAGKKNESPEINMVAAFALIGATLGWQATAAVFLIYASLLFLRYLGTGTASRFAGDLLIVTLLHHLTWRLQWLSIFG